MSQQYLRLLRPNSNLNLVPPCPQFDWQSLPCTSRDLATIQSAAQTKQQLSALIFLSLGPLSTPPSNSPFESHSNRHPSLHLCHHYPVFQPPLLSLNFSYFYSILVCMSAQFRFLSDMPSIRKSELPFQKANHSYLCIKMSKATHCSWDKEKTKSGFLDSMVHPTHLALDPHSL